MTSFEWFRSLAEEGHFICQIGYEQHPLSEAWEDSDGTKWDICKSCQAIEAQALEQRNAGN